MRHVNCARVMMTLELVIAAAGTTAGAVIVGDVTDARVAAETTGENWLVKGGSFAQQQFSALRQITAENVNQLGLAWVTEITDPMGLAAEPIVVDGVIYLSAPRSVVYAIEAASGKILWTFDPKVRLDYGLNNSYAARVNRGVAVWAGKVYVATGDCRLVAIDAAEGIQIWSSPICDPHLTGSTGAPRVARGKVFIGYNGSEDQVRGSLTAFDAETGKQAWRFWTVPGDPAKGFENKALEMAAKTWSGPQWWWHGGGDVWDAITFDAKTGLLLFSTSTAHRGEGTTRQQTSGGAKLFSGCIVAVRADTGEYAWHFQTSTPRQQTENFHIVLADIMIGGRMRHVALTVPRVGTFTVLDAATGELISRRPMVRQGWLHPLTAQERATAPADRFETPVDASDYPSETAGTVEDCPGGGCFSVHNWWPMSYSPATQLTYVSIIDRRRNGPTPPGGVPFVGKLVAWDVKTQSARWSVEHSIPVNSGVLSTAGNLVFHGEGTGEFAAYAADTGAKLWSIQTGSAIDAVPVTFSVKGEQYVVVPVGWGSASRLFGPASMMVTKQSKYGPVRLLAFKLGSRVPFPYPHLSIPEVPRPPKQTFSKEAVERGERLADSHDCTSCHSPQLDGSGAWTVNGGVPDLRYMPPEAHRDWYAIVLSGSHRLQGMMAFGVPMKYPEISALSQGDADDIHAYVIDRAWAAYEEQQGKPATQ